MIFHERCPKAFECAKRSWNKFRWYLSGKLIHQATTSCETSLSNVAKFYTERPVPVRRFSSFGCKRNAANRDAAPRRGDIARTETWGSLEKYIIACKQLAQTFLRTIERVNDSWRTSLENGESLMRHGGITYGEIANPHQLHASS